MKDLDYFKYYGGHRIYSKFIQFVREILAPHMSMEFQEEAYYYDVWKSYYLERFSVTEIARGHSKSEFGIWVMVYDCVFQPKNYFSGKYMNEFLVVGADNQTTLELNQRIGYFFHESEVLKQYLPGGVKKDKDKKTQRWNSQTLEFANGSKIHFRSIKTKRGLHVDRIWLDDPTTESSTLSDRETFDFVTGAILPMGTVKDAIVNFTGTPLRITDILNVMANTETFIARKMPAINEDGSLLSPNRFSLRGLDDIKKTIGSTKFACEYMLNPIDDSVSLIKRDWVSSCFDINWDLDYSDFSEVYLGVDFAFADRITSDFSAYVDLGVVRNGSKVEYHILNYRREKGKSINEQLEDIGLKYAQAKYSMIGLEENSIKSVSKDLKDFGLPIKLIWTGTRDSIQQKMPKDLENSVHSISKINAINRLALKFENGQFVIPYRTEHQQKMADIMLEELTSWALEEGKLVEIGLHPDGPMALIMAMEIADLNRVIVV